MASSEDINSGTDSKTDKREVDVIVASSVEATKVVVDGYGTVHSHSERVDAFDFYSCEEAIKRLNDYLDSELQPDEKEDVVKHLQICAPCLERFHFEKSLIATMRERVCRSAAPLKLKERLAALIKSNKQ